MRDILVTIQNILHLVCAYLTNIADLSIKDTSILQFFVFLTKKLDKESRNWSSNSYFKTFIAYIRIAKNNNPLIKINFTDPNWLKNADFFQNYRFTLTYKKSGRTTSIVELQEKKKNSGMLTTSLDHQIIGLITTEYDLFDKFYYFQSIEKTNEQREKSEKTWWLSDRSTENLQVRL